MKVDYLKPPITGEPTPPRILMQPETDKDRQVLEKIVERGAAIGTGYDPDSRELIHVEVLAASGEQDGGGVDEATYARQEAAQDGIGRCCVRLIRLLSNWAPRQVVENEVRLISKKVDEYYGG